METMQWSDPGLMPGLRDMLRALATTDTDSAWQVPDVDVSEGLALVGRARQLLEAAEVALVREGVTRGLPSQGSWSTHDWVSVSEGRRSPRPTVGHVSSVVRVATAGDRPNSGLAQQAATAWTEGEESSEAESPSGVAAVVGAFAEGDLPLGKADQLVRFHESVRRVADPDLLEADLGILLGKARDEMVATGPEGRTRVRAHGMDGKTLAAAITMTARMLRPEKDLKDEDEQQKASRSLAKSAGPCGMSRYTMLLDPEGTAIVDAALAALSGPVKGPDGERDERTPARRRADALLAIIGRGVSSPGEASKSDKAQVLVTISLQALTAQHGRCGACGQERSVGAFAQYGQRGSLGVFDPAGGARGHAGGRTATDEVLAPSVVRKMACEGGIIPVILGADSEPLELGRTARYFTPGQKRALWLRDGGCTYPGCTMPAHWSDAHHLDYWSLGGSTDIDRAALLCERHHTKVHQHDLTATVDPSGVTWHL